MARRDQAPGGRADLWGDLPDICQELQPMSIGSVHNILGRFQAAGNVETHAPGRERARPAKHDHDIWPCRQAPRIHARQRGGR